jgi:hypothetical protein
MMNASRDEATTRGSGRKPETGATTTPVSNSPLKPVTNADQQVPPDHLFGEDRRGPVAHSTEQEPQQRHRERRANDVGAGATQKSSALLFAGREIADYGGAGQVGERSDRIPCTVETKCFGIARSIDDRIEFEPLLANVQSKTH